MNKREYDGRNAIFLARCSTGQQVEYSIPQQNTDMHSFQAEAGFTVHDEMSLDGVSGLDVSPEARWDIDEIVDRKLRGEDFDLVVIPCIDRLTRGGAQHGFWIKQEFQNVGIELLSARKDIPTGTYGWLLLGMKLEEALAEVVGITHRFVRGYAASVLDGRNVHAPCPPLGVDRLYSTIDGTRLHRIRNLEDGRQLMMTPEGETPEAILREFPANVPNQKSQHWSRREGEYVTYVPGAPEHVATIKYIFHAYFVEGIGTHLIARRLNDRGTPTRKGRTWSACSVETTLRNTTYTGLGIANRSSNAVVCRRGTLSSTPIPVDASSRFKRSFDKAGKPLKNRRYEYRDPKDHLPVRYPLLSQMLDNLTPEQRDYIRAFQRERYERLAAGLLSAGQRQRGGDRESDTPYILKGILMCKQDGEPMTGHPTGVHRYYQHTRARRKPISSTIATSIRANDLEEQVLKCVQVTLDGYPNLSELIERVALETCTSTGGDDQRIERLRFATLSVLSEIKSIAKGVAKLGPEIVEQMTAEKTQAYLRMRSELEIAERRSGLGVVDTSKLIASVVEGMRNLHQLVRERRLVDEVRTLLAKFILKLEYDVETKVVDLHLGISARSFESPNLSTRSLVANAHSVIADEASSQKPLILGIFSGVYTKLGGRKGKPSLHLSQCQSVATPTQSKIANS